MEDNHNLGVNDASKAAAIAGREAFTPADAFGGGLVPSARTAPAVRIVQVTFEGSAKRYAYYTDLDLQVGDYAVVASPYGRSYGIRGEFYSEELQGNPTIVRVESVEETVEAIDRVAKWIIQRVDVGAYAYRVAREERRKVLLAKIKKAEKAAREQLEMEKLRELSPGLGKLIDELKAL